MIGSTELPKGWARTRVDALVQLINGFAFKPTQWKGEGLPIIRIQNLNNPDAPFNYCPENLPDKIRVRNGDLLFAWSGTPGTSFGAHIWRGEDAWLNQHIFKVLFNREYLDERFLRLAINQNLDNYIRQAHGGAGLAHITKGRFEESELSVAPLNEQRRIVAKIEELFSDLDAGVAALKRAKANLKRYRAAVLKAAVEGKLTEEWRAMHPTNEPASALLARILKERRQKWEAEQLARFTAAGKEPPKNWREKYVEPSPPVTTGLPELPDGWCWASLDALLKEPLRNGHSARASGDGSGVRTLTLTAVTYGEFSENNIKYTTADPVDVEDLWIEPGDIFIERSNTPELVGTARLFTGTSRFAIFPDLLIRIRVSPSLDVGYCGLFLESHLARRYFQTNAKGLAGSMPKIDQSTIMRCAVPLPPLSEQMQIRTEVAERLSQIDAAETKIAQSLLRATRLRQSILKQAFEGKLVPQDPRDEPASVLLDRLRANRSVHEGNDKATTQSRPRGRRGKSQQLEGRADE
jgi:type I restriction enzyme S subunit